MLTNEGLKTAILGQAEVIADLQKQLKEVSALREVSLRVIEDKKERIQFLEKWLWKIQNTLQKSFSDSEADSGRMLENTLLTVERLLTGGDGVKWRCEECGEWYRKEQEQCWLCGSEDLVPMEERSEDGLG